MQAETCEEMQPTVSNMDDQCHTYETRGHATTAPFTESQACTEVHTRSALAAPLSWRQADAQVAAATQSSDLSFKLKSKAASAILGRTSGAARQHLTHNIHGPDAKRSPMQVTHQSCATENRCMVGPILHSTLAGREQADSLDHSRCSDGATQEMVSPALWDAPKPSFQQHGGHSVQIPLDSVLAQQVQSGMSVRFAEEASLEGLKGVDAQSQIQTQIAPVPTAERMVAVACKAADCAPEASGISRKGFDGMKNCRSSGLLALMYSWLQPYSQM